MLGVFAEFEREMIVDRTKMGLAKKAARGKWKGGPSPYGYSYDPERRLLVPIEEEAAKLAGSSGSTAIAAWARWPSASG